MGFRHIFKLKTEWSSNGKEGTVNARNYSRNHTVTIKGKPESLKVSAAKMFKGEDALYNPEDLLLSSVSSCHMMSYFYVCSQNNVEVLSYKDNAEGVLEVGESGKGQFISIQLNPEVVVRKPEMITLAKSLHEEANQLCFIANSCNFPISHKVSVAVL
jgi:organic hydroperoxide reductase OsmC/OhrA